jgi:KDO2-lipid IV(A) lauroyltransferase
MSKSLRAGRAIWYAPDQDYGRKASVFVPVFGVMAATVTATSTFARLGKAQVVPFTQTRLPGGQGYQLTVHPPLAGFPSGNEGADALRINEWAEQAILEQPEQYMWVHRRFKTRPEGEERPYALRRKRKSRTRP